MSTATLSAERFRAAIERRDLDAVGELLAPDVVFHSPVTFHPFAGRETVTRLLGEVAQVFADFRYTTSWPPRARTRSSSARAWASGRSRASTCCISMARA